MARLGKLLGISRGAVMALAAALLFGASTPFAKLLLGEVSPAMMAGLLYLGAGGGLAAVYLVGRRRAAGGTEAAIAQSQWFWLGAAALFGGTMAPLCLMFGLTLLPAATTSLLLNLEGPLSALLAWAVFAEHVDGRVAAGFAVIVAGALVLSWSPDAEVTDLLGVLAIAGACLGWAIDNNLTRKISAADPVAITMWKSLVAAAVNIAIALGLGDPWPGPLVSAAAALVGFLGYGLSLALFVGALRLVGTARTAAYFSVNPFAGALIAVLLLSETITWQLLVAGLLMALGLWLQLTERHEHEHAHEEMEHDHRHVHDAHHQHDHGPLDPPGEPHSHRHRHEALVHRHPHYPDLHHRHGHGKSG